MSHISRLSSFTHGKIKALVELTSTDLGLTDND